MTTTDVTIRGAGIFGLSCAWAMARRGARVTVIDPHGIGAGASGGIVGALSPHVPENWNEKKQFQLESLLAAEGWWHGVETASGLSSGYARSGRLQPLSDEAAIDRAEERRIGARDHWGDHADWQVVPAPADWGPVTPTDMVIRDTLSARIHPRMALAALAAAIGEAGGEILRDGPDTGPILWATGPHDLSTLDPPGKGIKGQAALLAHDALALPQIFADGIHIVPHADGTTAIGSTTERDATDLVTDAQIDALVDRARACVPALAQAQVVERWAGYRPRTRSRAPVLGPHPSRDGAWIANGGFKIGFGMAPRVAEVMADLILDDIDAIPNGFRA